MKRTFNCRPSFPKYTRFWDVSLVLHDLASYFPHEQLDLKCLTFKLAILLLLLTGQRGQTIHRLNTRSDSVKDNTLHIFVDHLVKQSKPGRRQPEFTFSPFSENSALCVVTVYLEYMRRTQPLRAAPNDSPLLLSYVKPHAGISRDTLSRWIKTVMCDAGIDMSMFTAHSTRGQPLQRQPSAVSQ